MSPGHCRTDMGGQQALNSCESGAKTIYQCIFMENTDSEVFYHRARPSDFLGCGQ